MPLPRVPHRLSDAVRAVRRAVLTRRRLLAFVCTTLAVLAGLRALAPPAPATVRVTVAAHDLAAGWPLEPADVRVVSYAAGTAPDGRIRDPVGRTLAAPMRRGEPVTDARLVGRSLTAGRPDLVTMPVRLPDPAMAGLLHVGDAIDLLAADPQGGPPSTVSRRCLVLALPAADASGSGPMNDTVQGRLVVLGVPEADVTSVAGASVAYFLTFDYSR